MVFRIKTCVCIECGTYFDTIETRATCGTGGCIQKCKHNWKYCLEGLISCNLCVTFTNGEILEDGTTLIHSE